MIPPWLNIGPSDFNSSIRSGAELGLQLARMRQEAELQAQRLNARGGSITPPQVSFGGSPRMAAPAPAFDERPQTFTMPQGDNPQIDFSNRIAQSEARDAYNAENANNPAVDKAAYPAIPSPAEIAANKIREANLKDKLALQHDAQAAAEKLAKLKPNNPLLRTVNGTVVQIDRETGEATPIISVPPQERTSNDPVQRLIDAIAGPGAAQGTSKAIPQEAIDELKKNPETKGDFDAIFGAGSADKILGDVPTLPRFRF